MNYNDLKNAVAGLLEKRGRCIAAIDGPCASGKTTLAARLGRELGGCVLHTDDFYLPHDLRPKGWQAMVAGHMDIGRFYEEALLPAREGRSIQYRAYDCASGAYGPAIVLPPARLYIVEGAYCLHPRLRGCYDIAAFLEAGLPLRRERLLRRNGPEGLRRFEQIWMPMEDRYFQELDIKAAAGMVLEEA